MSMKCEHTVFKFNTRCCFPQLPFSDIWVHSQGFVFSVTSARHSLHDDSNTWSNLCCCQSAWPRYSLSLLNINIYDMYLGIEPISLRGEGKKNGWCAKLAHCSFLQASVCLSPSRASRQAFSPRSNCYLAQSSHPLQLQSSLSPFFHLLPLSPPGARKHTLITVSYLWWCFNNSWPQVSGACAGVVRVIHHDLANLSLNCQGHSRLCNGKCGQRQQP